jgi:tRNA N6-adenosine threonylcarbamoyltransferase
MIMLGIETSCDETAASIVRRTKDGTAEILSNVVLSQIEDHAAYGGVVPEIAARAHVTHLDGIVAKALKQADVSWSHLDGVAATAGPGLIGGVIVGLMTAKSIALVHDLPLIAVNHLEGHALTARLTHGIDFPYLLLLVSGGHTQLLCVEDVGQYQRLGTTIDDALGEAFDKTAKLLGLGFPGGPAVELAAVNGDPQRFALPRPMVGRAGCDFSFSGLKTALRRQAEALTPLSGDDIADLCASFQAAICDIILNRTRAAMEVYAGDHDTSEQETMVVAGGVAANTALRSTLEKLCDERGFRLITPPLKLCTDNAAMIAWAGAERMARGLTDDLNVSPRARWPLDPTARAAPGAGVKA